MHESTYNTKNASDLGTHSRTPALKTENFSKQISRCILVKRENAKMDLRKRSCPYFARAPGSGDGFSKSNLAFY